MKKQKSPQEGLSASRKKIADEILYQIGKSVILVLLVVAIVAIGMVGWTVMSAKENELTLESKSAANQVTGFLERYTSSVDQLAVNPEIQYVLRETRPGDDIRMTDKMDDVRRNLLNIVNTDPDNIFTTWIADLDTSTLTQSDDYTSDSSWDITTRVWFGCIASGDTILTEPYLDPASGKIIVSAVAPVYDETTGDALG